MSDLQAFICYSHKDAKWFDEKNEHCLIPWLEDILGARGINLWYDRGGLKAGDQYLKQLSAGIDHAQIALLLISWNFLSSEFILKIELPRIQAREAQHQMTVIPVLLSPCDWQQYAQIEKYHILPGQPTPLVNYIRSDAEWEDAKHQILTAILNQAVKIRAIRAAEIPHSELQPEAINAHGTTKTASSPPSPFMEARPTPSSPSMPSGLRLKTLHDRKAKLLEDYEAANQQWSAETNNVHRLRLQRQIETLSHEIQALEQQIQELREEHQQPTGSSDTQTILKSRFLDAAIAKDIPVFIPTQLLAQVRRTESDGLRSIVTSEDGYTPGSEDVRSKPMQVEFPLDEQGRAQPVPLVLRVEAPDFDIPMPEKRLHVPPDGDSEVCTFVLTPRYTGELLVHLEVDRDGSFLASKFLHTNSQRSDRVPQGKSDYTIVSMSLKTTSIGARPALWRKYLVWLAVTSLGFVASLVQVLGLPQRLGMAVFLVLAFLGGVGILGWSALPRYRRIYLTVDRWITFGMLLLTTVILGYLLFARWSGGLFLPTPPPPTAVPTATSFQALPDTLAATSAPSPTLSRSLTSTPSPTCLPIVSTSGLGGWLSMTGGDASLKDSTLALT
jgi:hypothetical protein